LPPWALLPAPCGTGGSPATGPPWREGRATASTCRPTRARSTGHG
jgi:hypothetical protein